jgi:hypothetical protein
MSKRIVWGSFALALVSGLVCANAAEHVMVVSVEKVDKGTKTLVCKTADGTAETFKYTEKTMVTGTKDVAKASDLAGKDSYHFTVHYTEEGADKVATGMDFTGKGAWKATKGTVTAVDHATKTVTVKLADGTVETYHLADHCTVDTGKAIGKMSEDAGKGVVEGSQVTVHFTEEGGKKIAHFLHM